VRHILLLKLVFLSGYDYDVNRETIGGFTGVFGIFLFVYYTAGNDGTQQYRHHYRGKACNS